MPPLHLEDVFMGVSLDSVLMMPTKDFGKSIVNFLIGNKPKIPSPLDKIAIHLSGFTEIMPRFHDSVKSAISEGRRVVSAQLSRNKDGTMPSFTLNGQQVSSRGAPHKKVSFS